MGNTKTLIKYLYFLALLVWPFGLLLVFSPTNISFPIYLLDILVITTATLYLISNFKQLKTNKIFICLSVFALVTFVSLIINHSRIGMSSLAYSARLLFYPLILFVADSYKNETKKILLLSFSIFLVLGLVQYLALPDMRYLKNLGFDDHYYRLVGTFYDPNFTGAILGIFCLYFLVKKNYYLGAASLVSLALTFSRASYLAFFTGLFSYILWTKKYKLAISLVILAVMIYLVPKPFGEGVNLLRTFSIYSRLNNWQQNLSLFIEKPSFGYGYGTTRGIDGSPVVVLVSTGILGLIAFVLFLRQVFYDSSPLEKSLAVAVITHSLFNNSLFFIWIYFLFFVLFGSSAKVYRSP